MITKPNSLSLEDKAFMLCYPEFFHFDTRTFIRFNNESWINELEKYNINLYNDMHEDKVKFLKTFMDYDLYKDYPENSKFLSKLASGNLPIETDDDILEYINFVFLKLKRSEYHRDSINVTDETRYDMLKRIFDIILCKKLIAKEIVTRNNMDIRPASDQDLNFYLRSIPMIIHEIFNKHDIQYKAMLCYQLSELLHFNRLWNNDEIEDIFVYVVHIIEAFYDKHNDVMTKFRFTLRKLLKNEDTDLSIFNDISEDFSEGFNKYIKNNFTNSYKENLKKNIINQINNTGLIIGDDVLPCKHIITINELMTELRSLNEEKIQSYLLNIPILKDYANDIVFSISENDVGYLKMKEKMPIVKVAYNNVIPFKTLTKKDDDIYLLFKFKKNNHFLIGISLLSKEDQKRTILEMHIPNNEKYYLDMRIITND